MKASTKRTLSLLTAIGLLAGSLIVYSNFLKQEYAEIQKLRGELTAQSQLYEAEASSVSQIQQLLSKSQSSMSIKEALSLALPETREQIADIINQLSVISSNEEMKIRSVSLGYLPIEPSQSSSLVKGAGVLKITLELQGSYNQFKKWLKDIETNIRLMDVKILKIESAEKTTDLFRYNLIINAYYQTN